MDIELILQKFAVFSGLTGEELQACLPYCRDAMEQLTAKRRSALPAEEPLGSAAAALAYYRWCLAQMSGSSLPHVGAAALVNKDTLAAAKALCEEYLAAAAALDARATPGLVYPEDREAARRRAKSICAREFGTPGKGTEHGRCERLFLSAITCEGRIFFPDTIAAQCERVYLLDDGCGLAEEFLHIVRAHAGRCGLDVLSCPDPLIPSRTQAVLVPSRGVGFLAGTADDVPEGLTQRHIRLDVLPDPVRQRALRRTMRSDTRQQQLALASAVEQLRMANLLHNELEAVYRPCMDFAALTTFTDRYLHTFPGA